MNKLFGLFLLALACWVPSTAWAVNCFWVGGTGTWDNSAITHWAPTTGGAATGCQTSNAAPATGDVVTFDASSGGGTVTAASSINGLSLASITSGAFTGTLDFSANNPSMTFTSSTGFNAGGSGVRKYLMGTGTFTFTSSGFVFTLNGSNIDGTSNFSANYTFAATSSSSTVFTTVDGKTYGALTISTNTSRGLFDLIGSSTFSSVSLAAGTNLRLQTGKTSTITNAFTWTGTSSNPINIFSDNPTSGAAPILSVSTGTSTLTWGGLYKIATSGGGTFNATNSFDFGFNTWSSITGPSAGGGGGRIIGG